MWRRDKFKFPPGPYRGLKGWSFRALRQNPLEMFSELARCGDIVGIRVVNFRNIFVDQTYLDEVGVIEKNITKIFLSITPTSSRKFWSATRAATSKGAFCGRTGTFLGKDCSRAKAISGCGRGGWCSRGSIGRASPLMQ